MKYLALIIVAALLAACQQPATERRLGATALALPTNVALSATGLLTWTPSAGAQGYNAYLASSAAGLPTATSATPTVSGSQLNSGTMSSYQLSAGMCPATGCYVIMTAWACPAGGCVLSAFSNQTNNVPVTPPSSSSSSSGGGSSSSSSSSGGSSSSSSSGGVLPTCPSGQVQFTETLTSGPCTASPANPTPGATVTYQCPNVTEVVTPKCQ